MRSPRTKSINTPLSFEQKRRLVRLAGFLSAVLACGLAYAGLCTALGFALPCLFFTATGLQCPGCGVTRMCLNLLRLDFGAAWRYNPGLLALAPALAVLAFLTARQYVRIGTLTPTRFANALTVFCIVWLLVWGVWRNIV